MIIEGSDGHVCFAQIGNNDPGVWVVLRAVAAAGVNHVSVNFIQLN